MISTNVNIITTDQGDLDINDININFNTIEGKLIKNIIKTFSIDRYFICFEKDSLEDSIPNNKLYLINSTNILYNKEIQIAEKFVNNHNIHKIKYNGEIILEILLDNINNSEINFIKINNIYCESTHMNDNYTNLYKLIDNYENLLDD